MFIQEDAEGLTDAELAALSEEFSLGSDSDGERDENESDEELASIKQALTSALQTSEKASAEDNTLAHLAGYEEYSATADRVSTTLNSYKVLNHEASLLLKEVPAPSTAVTGAAEAAAGGQQLDNVEVFEMALAIAVRGAMEDTLSVIEDKAQSSAAAARKAELLVVQKRQAEQEAEIEAQRAALDQSRVAAAAERDRQRDEARAAREAFDLKMKQEIEDAERLAAEEMAAAKAAQEEKRRRNVESKAKIEKDEEVRWTLTSKVTTFVQSRMRGLMGRKSAIKVKEAKELEKADKVTRGVHELNKPVVRVAMRHKFAAWRRNVSEMARREMECREAAVRIQCRSRRNNALVQATALRKSRNEKNGATRMQQIARCLLARKAVERLRKEKSAREQQERIKEEARKKYELELRRRQEEEDRLRALEEEREEKARLEEERKQKAEEERRQIAAARQEREQAELTIHERLYKSPPSKAPRPLCPHAVREERRRQSSTFVAQLLKAAASAHNGEFASPPLSSAAGISAPPRPQQGGVAVDEDMLSGLGNLSVLQTLTLNVEEITDASNIALLGATALTSLSLNVNCLRSLTSIQQLTKLERLSVKDNKLVSLDGMKPLQSLVELLLDVNKLASLEALQQSSWFNLASLSANTNEIRSLPNNLGEHLPSLCSLSLYQNNIEQIEANTFRNLPSLTALDLGRNRLRDSGAVALALNSAPTIRRLILSQHQFPSAPPLCLPLLQQLWLSGNQISSMELWKNDSSCFLPCLLELYLQENGMERVGGEGVLCYACPILDKVDLKLNSLCSIDDVISSLAYLDFLATVDIQDNPVLQASGNSHILNDRLLQALPRLHVLNGSSVASDAKLGAITTACCSASSLIMPKLAELTRLPNCDKLLLTDDESEGAAEIWGSMRSKNPKCSRCSEAVSGSVCPRCSCLMPPANRGKPLALDWRVLVGGDAAASDEATGFTFLCKKMNSEGAKQRLRWKKALESNERSVRHKAMEDHNSLLQRQLNSVLSGEEAWFWDVVENSEQQTPAKKNSNRKVNSTIALAATMRMQCCARRFLGLKRAKAARLVRKRLVAALNCQRLFRGWRLRKKLKAFGAMNFSYEDDELRDILGDGSGEDFDFNAFGLGDDAGLKDEEEEWKPTKPVAEMQHEEAPREAPRVPVQHNADAWRTPSGTPSVGVRENVVSSGSRVEMMSREMEEREVSSPFGGHRREQQASGSELDMMSLNLRKNGFDFAPPNRMGGGGGGGGIMQDDMEIKSVTTADDDAASALDTARRSRKEDKQNEVMKEWGFTDPKIAAMMMKRSKRMDKGKIGAKQKAKMKDPYYRFEKLKRAGPGGGGA
jgi:Leucine-rich repeat (LRR) protein